jgi:nucleoside-diphosphate-sugar epimerase
MNIFISGATGFIGRQLSLRLAEQGHTIHALSRRSNHPLLPVHQNIRVFLGDISNKNSLMAAMQDCEQAYHTAALARMWTKDKNEFHEVNVTGTRNVLEAAKEAGVGRVVHTSSCGVIGPTIKYPMTEEDPRITGFPIHYERTKYLAELEAQEFARKGMDVVIVCPSRVYGKGPVTDSNTVGKIVTAYLKGKWRVNPANGKQVSNYAYLDDVVRGHIAAMERGKTGHRYILGGEDISFNAFFDTVKQISGVSYRLINVPQSAIKWYSWIEWLKTSVTGYPPFFLPEFADRLKHDQKYSSQKAIDHLGYRITPFDEGMRQMIHYYLSGSHADHHNDIIRHPVIAANSATLS